MPCMNMESLMKAMADIRRKTAREIKLKVALGLEPTEDERMLVFECEMHEACLGALVKGKS